MNTPEKRRALVYILAPSYTGSTLLTFLLAGHEKIATIGELKATARGDLDTYRCSCGSVQRECGFWKTVVEEMRRTDPSFTLDDFETDFRSDSRICNRLLRAGVRGRGFESIRDLMLRLLPSCRRRLGDLLERNYRLIEVICRVQQKEVFLDGSKDPIRFKLLNMAARWDVKVIYLIRDGRGATSSYMRHRNTSMDTAAREWCRTQQECDRIVRALGDGGSLRVHYEDLCLDPKSTLARIYDFLGLGGDPAALRFRSSQHHILGNDMRLKSTDEIRLDEKWKTQLTREDLDCFERVAGAQNRLYGYANARSSPEP